MEILFFLFLLVFYLMWARVQPMGAGPDEQMRYQIADYIYKHGSLPVGDDPSVRNVVWGISYAFSPILSYMIAAVFMKAVSFVTTAPFALLLAARFVNILFGLGTVWLVLDMGKRLFDRRKAWIVAAFVGLLPGSLFVFTYVNCDALAVFSTAVIVYAWVRYLTDEGWIYKNCVILALGVAACALSYYNAYGFILCSIFFFGITLFMEAKKKGKYTDFVKKGLLVCVIVLLLAAWWFIRNAILYDGDFIGMNASTICAEKYAKKNYKPSNRRTPQMAGYSLLDMLNYGFPQEDGFSWVELVSESFVGRFGNMDVFMPKWLINNYMDFIKAGFLADIPASGEDFCNSCEKTVECEGDFQLVHVDCDDHSEYIECILFLCIGLSAAGTLQSADVDPDAAYYFMVMGYGNLFDVQIKNDRACVRRCICCHLCGTGCAGAFCVLWRDLAGI